VLEVVERVPGDGAESVGKACSAADALEHLADRILPGEAHEQVEGAVRGAVYRVLLRPVELRIRTQQIDTRVIRHPCCQLLGGKAPAALVGRDRGHSFAEPERWLFRRPGRSGC